MIKTFVIFGDPTTVAQVLDEAIVGITSAQIASTSSLAVGQFTKLTPVTGAPTSTQIQFTGTVTSPSATVTLSAVPATNQQIVVKGRIAAGSLPGY